MKYEMIFGDQSLFDGAPEGVVIAIKRPFISGVRSEEMYFFSSTFDAVMKAGSSFNFNNVILKTDEYAERRIIAEPKRWTWEDKNAGRLPEVGSKFFESGYGEDEVIKITDNSVVSLRPGNHGAVSISKQLFFMEDGSVSPIETPAEKAQREEDEFIRSLAGTDINYGTGTVKELFEQGAREAYRKLKGGE